MTYPTFIELGSRGFDGTGYRFLSNDPIGGYGFIIFIDGFWTEIYIERGQQFTNKIFQISEAESEIQKFLSEKKIVYFSGPEEMFSVTK